MKSDKWHQIRRLALAWLVAAEKLGVDPKTMTRRQFLSVKPPGIGLRILRRHGGLDGLRLPILDVLGGVNIDQCDIPDTADEIADRFFFRSEAPEETTETVFPTSDPVAERRAKEQDRARAREREELIRRLDAAEARLEAHESMAGQDRVCVLPEQSELSGRRIGRVLLVLSDWHPGDIVDPVKVNGLNEFNQEILVERATRLVEGFRWTLEMWRTQYDLVELVIGILGDMVTGWIHEEQLASTSMTPPEEVVFGADLLYSTIIRLLKEQFPSIHVVCVTGNHGRTTRRIHHSNRGTTSYEWILYHDLKNRIQREDPGVTFNIPNSEFAYEPIGPLTVRFAHGDFFRYSNGVGGITIPMNKALYRQDQACHADLTCMGHWHQYMSMPRVALNGTMKGYDSFSQHCGFSPEPPSQTMILIDERRGFPWAKRLWV